MLTLVVVTWLLIWQHQDVILQLLMRMTVLFTPKVIIVEVTEDCDTNQTDATSRNNDALRPVRPMSTVYGNYE